METQFSPSSYLVNKTQQFFAVNKDEKGNSTDSIITRSIKCLAGALPNAVLAIAALVETVVFAVLTAATLIPSILIPRPYNYCRTGTVLAATTAIRAFKGIVGCSTPLQIKKVTVEDKYSNIWQKMKSATSEAFKATKEMVQTCYQESDETKKVLIQKIKEDKLKVAIGGVITIAGTVLVMSSPIGRLTALLSVPLVAGLGAGYYIGSSKA